MKEEKEGGEEEKTKNNPDFLSLHFCFSTHFSQRPRLRHPEDPKPDGKPIKKGSEAGGDGDTLHRDCRDLGAEAEFKSIKKSTEENLMSVTWSSKQAKCVKDSGGSHLQKKNLRRRRAAVGAAGSVLGAGLRHLRARS